MATRTRTGLWLNLLQAGVTVLVAAGVVTSALASSRATGEWHSASRQEIKWSAAAVEDLRYVYADEAPLALTIAMGEARREPAESQVVGHLRLAHRGSGGLLDGDRYRLANGGGYDLARRLADVRAADPGLRDLDPERAMAAGDRDMRQARRLALATIPLVLLFLAARAAIHWSAGRAAAEVPDVGLVPGPAMGYLALCAWVLMTILPAGVLIAGGQEQRAQAVAAQRAEKVSAAIAGGSVVQTFRAEAARALTLAELRSTAHELVAVDDRRQHGVSVAEQAALPAQRRLVAEMSRMPGAEAGVDVRTGRLAAAGPVRWELLRLEQNRAAAGAERAGERGDRLQIAVALAGLAFILTMLAAAGHAATVVRRAALGMLVLTGLVTVAAYLA